MKPSQKSFVKIQECTEPIVAMQKLGGFFKKGADGKRYWYPERLIVAHRHSIYEWIPEEKTIALYTGKTYKVMFKKKGA